MSKTYNDGLKDALGQLEDVFAEYSPLDDFDENIEKVVKETYKRVNELME